MDDKFFLFALGVHIIVRNRLAYSRLHYSKASLERIMSIKVKQVHLQFWSIFAVFSQPAERDGEPSGAHDENGVPNSLCVVVSHPHCWHQFTKRVNSEDSSHGCGFGSAHEQVHIWLVGRSAWVGD